MPNVEIYTQPWCPYCSLAKALLERKQIAFREIHAPSGSAERDESVRRSGRSSVPQIFIDGVHIGGCDDLMALDAKGKLDPLLAGA
jgi:glutaredoxin 3